MEHLMNKIINNNNKNNKNILNKTSLSDFIMKNNSPLQKVRCAIYTRKSCEDGLELEYNSLENQYDACAGFVKSHEADGWFVINKRYDDGGFSGGSLDRPALKELLNDVNLGLIDKIIIYKLDRISRSNMDYYKLADILQRKNVDIEIATQQFDRSTSIGRFSFGMMLNFAQLEREMTSDRIKEKIRKQQSLGMWTGGITPIGYDVVDKKLIVNEYEANIVKTIFNTYYKTKSINFVLDVLNKNNFKTKLFVSKSSSYTRGGANFNRGSIYKILNNKIYIGKIENKVINKVFDGLHEAIIDEELFNQVQEILKENMNTKIYDIVDDAVNNNSTESIKKYLPKKNSKMPYLLKGMMRCECCNSILTPVFTTKKKSGISYRYYKPNKAIKHSTSCKIGNIPAEQIENIVLNQLYNVLSSPSIINGVVETINEFKSNSLKSNANINNNIDNNSIDNNNINVDNTINIDNNPTNSILNITESEIIKSLKNIQAVWNELFPKEQMQIVRVIIKEIIISEFNVKIIFSNQNITNLLIDAGMVDVSKINNNSSSNNSNSANELEDILNIKLNNDDNNISSNNSNTKTANYFHEVNIPVDFRYKAGRSFITTPAGKDISIVNANIKRVSSCNQNDLAVISALLKAESWKKEIETKNINISYISKRENKTITYITRILNLSFLAPDIKKAILCQQTKLGITLLDLYKCANEVNWNEQRELLNML